MLNALNEKQVDIDDTKPIASAAEFNRMKSWLEERIQRGKKTPHCEIVALTPVLATLLLDRNPVNRPIGRYNMETLRSDVSGSRFLFNGESIVVSDSGVLIDGQHRCTTVIETRQTITTVIVFGPKEEARYTIDIGKPKTAAHFLHMKGGVDTNNLAATIALLIQYGQNNNIHHGYVRPTKTQIVQGGERFRGVELSLDAVAGATKKKLGSRSALAFCHYTFKRKAGVEAADNFFQKLIDGDGLRKGDPIYHCRERLLKLDRGSRADVRAEIIFKGWNSWRRNETVTSIRTNGKLPKVER